MAHDLEQQHEYYLPLELWTIIFEDLGRKELKQLRLANTVFKNVVTPMLFKTISFQFTKSSFSNLARISCDPNLSALVRRLELHGMQRMLRFSEQELWEECISLPEDPIDEPIEDGNTRDLMSFQEWSSMSLRKRKALFKKYDADCLAAEDEFRHLVNHPTTFRTDHLRRLLKAFVKLTEFVHYPNSLLAQRFVTRWQQLRMDPRIIDHDDNCILDIACSEIEDKDALQVACVLQALGQSLIHLNMLNVMRLQIGGPAFWGPYHLWHLWEHRNHAQLRDLRSEHLDAFYAQDTASRDFRPAMRKTSLRSLNTMLDVFVKLTRLECLVHEYDGERGLEVITVPLFAFLSQAENLKVCRLSFGMFQDGKIVPSLFHHEWSYGGTGLLELLAEHKPWPHITELTLETTTRTDSLLKFMDSIGPTLRQLTLSNMTLTTPPTHDDDDDEEPRKSREATWDHVLPEIAQRLPKLESINLSMLSFPRPYRSWNMPAAPTFFDPDLVPACGCSAAHMKAVTDSLLREKTLQVPVDLRLYCPHMSTPAPKAWPYHSTGDDEFEW